MKRHIRFKCKHCETELFDGVYNEADWTELQYMMEETKYTTCCGNFEHGAFPVLTILRGDEPPAAEYAGPMAVVVHLAEYRQRKIEEALELLAEDLRKNGSHDV